MTPGPGPVSLLAHQVAGQGEPLLLLNGGLMSLAAWEPIAAALMGTFRVVRCDLRGQLLSPGQAHPDLGGHVEDVALLLDALAIERAHVVGTSYGALVGLALAARHPTRAASIVAVTATDRITPEAWRESAPLLEACRAAARGGDARRLFELLQPGMFSPRYQAQNAALLAQRAGQMGLLPRAWFEGALGLLASLEGLDLGPELGRIRCPALVVAAAEDATFPEERSRALAAAIPGAELSVVPGSGHALVVEAPELLLERLRAFLARAAFSGGRS